MWIISTQWCHRLCDLKYLQNVCVGVRGVLYQREWECACSYYIAEVFLPLGCFTQSTFGFEGQLFWECFSFRVPCPTVSYIGGRCEADLMLLSRVREYVAELLITWNMNSLNIQDFCGWWNSRQTSYYELNEFPGCIPLVSYREEMIYKSPGVITMASTFSVWFLSRFLPCSISERFFSPSPLPCSWGINIYILNVVISVKLLCDDKRRLCDHRHRTGRF